MAQSVKVEFCCEAQDLGPLQVAAYRMIGSCTCEITKRTDHWHCVLTPTARGAQNDFDFLREQFLNFVTDENLRARIAQKTEGVRNVILALAFGSLVSSEPNTDESLPPEMKHFRHQAISLNCCQLGLSELPLISISSLIWLANSFALQPTS
jgi:His-Xaa-Ser system protein HxsD